MSDALFGPDGTQALPPPPTYRDALSSPMRVSERGTAWEPPPERTVPPAPVKASKPSGRVRQAATDTRRRPAAVAQTGAVSASPPQRVGPATRVTAAPRRRGTGAAVYGWFIALLIFGSLAFNVLHGVLRDLGILR